MNDIGDPFLLQDIAAQINAIRAEYPEVFDDEEWLQDVLEGQTELMPLLNKIVTGIRHDESMQEAITVRMRELDARKCRFAKREHVRRTLAQRIMESVELRKVETVEATLSVRPGAQKVVVVNPDHIPEAYWKVERRPSLNEIKAALKSGASVPGCTLSNGADTLALRSK